MTIWNHHKGNLGFVGGRLSFPTLLLTLVNTPVGDGERSITEGTRTSSRTSKGTSGTKLLHSDGTKLRTPVGGRNPQHGNESPLSTPKNKEGSPISTPPNRSRVKKHEGTLGRGTENPSTPNLPKKRKLIPYLNPPYIENRPQKHTGTPCRGGSQVRGVFLCGVEGLRGFLRF